MQLEPRQVEPSLRGCVMPEAERLASAKKKKQCLGSGLAANAVIRKALTALGSSTRSRLTRKASFRGLRSARLGLLVVITRRA